MEPQKSQTAFDPNRTPFTSPAARFTYLEHPVAGTLMINSDTKVITPIAGKQYVQIPLKLPKELMDVPQPNVKTCGVPDGQNKGCHSAVNGGCPIVLQYGRIGPCNLIMEKNGKVNSIPCYHAYVGITPTGRPTSQAHYLMDGHQILTDRTTIPENMVDPGTKREYVVQTEVPDLAPFYDHLKQPKKESKKRGRPRKEADLAHREDRPTA